MKRLISAVALLTSAAGDASSQTPAPAEAQLKHCYVEVASVADKNEIQRNWETSWGSYDRDRFQRTVLKVRVGTTSRTSGAVDVAVFWIGRRLIDNKQVVYGHERKTVRVPPAYFAEGYVVAPELISNVTNYATLGKRYVQGAKHDGWIVAVLDQQDGVLASKASSEPLRQLFHNRPEFAKLMPDDTSP
jgi:hypothetical protein